MLGLIRASLSGHSPDFTEGPLPRALFVLAVPMMLEMLMQSVFSVVDIYFVGRLGEEAVTAVGLTEALLYLVMALAVGLAMGTAAFVSRRIGEKDANAASHAGAQAMWLAVLISAPVAAIGALFPEGLLSWMGASSAVRALGTSYAAIVLGGSSTVFFLFLLNSIFRAAGDPVLAMKALWIANLLNMLLDPILIWGLGPIPALGVFGAGLATTIGRGVGVLYQLTVLFSRRGRIQVRRQHFAFDPPLVGRVLRVSSTGMFQYLVGTANWMLLMRWMNAFGDSAVAGYTIGVRIIVFALLPSWGVANAAATLVGQNLGAGKPERSERSVWLAARANAAFLLVVAIALFAFAEPLMRIFTSERAPIDHGGEFLRFIAVSYPCFAFGMVTVTSFNGAGDTWTPTCLNVICYWCIQLPLAYLLSIPSGWGPKGVYVAIGCSQVALALIGVVWFRRGKWKERTL